MSYTVLSSAVDTLLSRKSFGSHDAYFDVEAYPQGHPRAAAIGSPTVFALVMRSNDKTIIGRTDTPSNAELVFNDSTGTAVPFILVEAPAGPDGAAPQVLVDAAAQLVAFYTSDGSFSARYDALEECALTVLPLVMGVFGHKRRDRNGWKVGSIHGITAAAQAVAIAHAAKALNNADALAAALSQVSGNAGAPLSPELLAMVQQVWSMVGAAATSAPAATPVAA